MMIRCATKINNFADEVMEIDMDEYERLCKSKSLYEQIPDDQPVSLYADFDLKTKHLMEGVKLFDCTMPFIDIAKRGITDAILELGGITPPRFAHKTATKIDNTNPKLSFHIIVTNYKMTKIQQCELFKSVNKFINTYRDDKWADDYLEMTSDRRNDGFFDLSVYSKGRKMRSPFSTKEGEDRPFLITEGTFRDCIISMPADDATLLQIAMPEKKTTSAVTVTGDIDEEKYCDYMSLIPATQWNSYMEWFKVQRASANMGISFDIYDKFMRPCSGYDYENNLRVYQMPPDDKNGRLGWKYIYDTAYQSNPTAKLQLDEKYSTSKFKTIFKDGDIILNSDETAFAKMIRQLTKDDILLIADTYYIYVDDEWKCEPKKTGDIVKYVIMTIFQEYKQYCKPIVESKILRITKDESITEMQRTLNIKTLNDAVKMQEKKMGSVSFINNVYSIFRNIISKNTSDITFDNGANNDMLFHFKNGTYDFIKRTFRKTLKTDYVTKKLNYDFIPSSDIPSEKLQMVRELFEKIQPDSIERDFTLSYLAYSLTGIADKQVFKMNIGRGENGKSTEVKIHEASFPIYTRKVPQSLFKMECQKRHKTFAEFITHPIRLAFVEELPKTLLDTDFIKDWVDGGHIPVEIMFGTSSLLQLKSKLITTSNNYPKFDSDDGIKRRGRMQMYQSKFVDNDDCPEEHIYLKDETIIAKFQNDNELKNAYFHLLEPYVLKGLSIPDSAKEAFGDVADENDDIMCIINDFFEITKDDKDRLSKERVEELTGNKYKDVANKLKMLGAIYNKDDRPDGRKSGKRGCWRRLKLIESEDASDEEVPPRRVPPCF